MIKSVVAMFFVSTLYSSAFALPHVLITYPDNEEKKFVFSSTPLMIPTKDPAIECKLVDIGKNEYGSHIYQLGCKSGDILARTNVVCRKKGLPNADGSFFFSRGEKVYLLTGKCE